MREAFCCSSMPAIIYDYLFIVRCCTQPRFAAHCRTATHALLNNHTLLRTPLYSAARTARTARTPPCALPHTVTHCRTLAAARSAAHIRLHRRTLPYTAARTAIHSYYQARCRTLLSTLPHTAANTVALSHTAALCCILCRTVGQPHTIARTARAHFRSF
jgi:hypothetical protein